MTGIGLHCGGYASAVGSAGNHRTDVSVSLCTGIF